MFLLERANSLKEETKNLKEGHYRYILTWKLTNKRLQRVREEAEEKDVLIESPREAAKTRKAGEQGQRKGADEDTKSRCYGSFVQQGFYAFARAVYDHVLDYAKSEVSKLCFDWEKGERS